MVGIKVRQVRNNNFILPKLLYGGSGTSSVELKYGYTINGKCIINLNEK